ncbi:MAG: hypothetical protein ACLFVS_02615 [Candidatus Acetothermia bacterium]
MEGSKVLSFLVFSLLVAGLTVGISSPGFSAADAPKTEISDTVIERMLTFIHSAAELVGKGLVNLINVISGVNVDELEQPLGYLGILTASLIVFGAIKAAQKIVWFFVLLGWGLIIVRIVLEALDNAPSV